MSVLRGENVSKSYGGLVAVDDVDFEIEPGEIVGLIGPNGAGKSTLFDCITGAEDPDDGTIALEGEDITDEAEYRIAQRGLIRLFQETRVYDGMTLYENLLVSVDHSQESGFDQFRGYPDEAHERAEQLLREIDLWGKREEEAADLSFGQQKLLEFAMTLMTAPDVLLLDEPASGINPTMIQTVLDYLERITANREITLFVIEHNMDVIMDISERIYVMNNGAVLDKGEPAEIQQSDAVKQAYFEG